MSSLSMSDELAQPIETQGEYTDDEIVAFLEESVGKVIESAGIPMRVLSPDFEVLMQNSRMEEMGDIDAEAMANQGLHCYDQFSNDTVCGTENCTLNQLVDEDADAVSVEVPKYSYDGQEYQVEVIAEPIEDDAGNVIAISESFRDYTDIKRIVTDAETLSERIQDGELDTRMDTGDLEDYYLEMGESLNDLVATIQNVVEDIEGSVDELVEVSAAVVESTQEISELSGEQSHDISTVADEISGLSATVEEVAASTQDVNDRVSTIADRAADGQQDAEDTLEMMDAMAASIEEVNERITALHDAIDEIGEFIGLIDDIADQTNLLALNANIEAARVDEDGGGFEVVANEVKQLAEQTQDNAAEIESRIDEIQRQSSETTESIDAMTETFDRSREQITDSLDMLEAIATDVTEVANSVEELSDAADDQAASTEEIAATIDQTAEKAEEIADEAEQIAGMNEEEAAMIERIDTALSRFTTDDDG